MIPILILAAGQSSRMRGADKMCEDIGGSPLLRRQVLMAAATSAPVFVALWHNQAARAALLKDTPATLLTVSDAVKGLSGTLRGAVPLLPQTGAFMVMLADLIKLETSDLSQLMAHRQAYPDAMIWRATTADGKPGHPVIFADRLRADFEKLSGDQGAAKLIANNAAQTSFLPLSDDRACFDLDTPEEWAAWRATCR